MFLLQPFQLSTPSPPSPLSLPLSLSVKTVAASSAGQRGTGAAVIIDNYADLLTGCQQFVFSKPADHGHPPTPKFLPTNSPGDSRRNPGGSCQNLARNISANSDPNIKLISWRSRCNIPDYKRFLSHNAEWEIFNNHKLSKGGQDARSTSIGGRLSFSMWWVQSSVKYENT